VKAEIGGVTAIWGDARGNLWFGSQQTAPGQVGTSRTSSELEAVVARFDGLTWRYFTTTRDGLASGEITDIWGNGQGHVWVTHSNRWGGSGGVSAFNGQRWQVWQVQNGPPVPSIGVLAKDANGRLWLGTRKGVSLFDGAWWHNFGREDGLVSLDVEDLWIAQNGEVWIAHALSTVHPEQGGVSRFDGTQWTHYSPEDGLGGKDVSAIWGDDQGTVWAGGQQWSGKGTSWVARFDGNRWQTFPVEGGTVEAIWGDEQGTVWFRMTQGVNAYDGQEWHYYPTLRSVVETHYAALKGNPGSNPLWAVDLQGQIWIAETEGVARYDGQAWQTFDITNGLAGNQVRAIAFDRSGTLWFATDNGLTRTDGRTWRSFHTGNSGLGNNNVRGIYEDKAGNLFFHTDLWYTTYTPSPPQVRIERLISLADGQKYTPTTGLVLDYAHRSVQIEFSASAPWTPPRDIVYRYRLEGVDQTWHFLDNPLSTGTGGRAQYLELAPGTYTFVVAAGNRNLDYSDPVSLTFTIRSAPPVVTIEGVVVDGIRYAGDISLKTTHGKPKEVTIEFHGQDDRTSILSYRYRLGQGEWTPLATAPLTLTLPAGAYIFSFQAMDEEGNTSTEASTYIFVEELSPPTFRPAGDGYQYAFALADSGLVTVTLEVWDPVPGFRLWRKGSWRPLALETVRGGGERTGKVAPFNAFDVGHTSRARFWLEDGQSRSLWYTTDEFTVTGIPWIVYLAVYMIIATGIGGGLLMAGRHWLMSTQGQAWLTYWQVRGSPDALWSRASALLERETGASILEQLAQIARSRGRAEIAGLATALAGLVDPATAVTGLVVLRDYVRTPSPEAISWPDALLEALQAQRTVTITMTRLEEAARYHEIQGDTPLAKALRVLGGVSQILVRVFSYPSEIQLSLLNDALSQLETRVPEVVAELQPLERQVFQLVTNHWRDIIKQEQERLLGQAQLEIRLLTQQVMAIDEHATLALEIRNSGTGAATNVVVMMIEPGEEQKAPIPTLLPGEQVTLEMTVSAPASSFRVSGKVLYDDRLGEGYEEPFSGIVFLPPPPPWPKDLTNPYVIGRPLDANSPVFVGRQEIFEFVRSNVLGTGGQQVLALIGQRRMGKTSILQQLPQYLAPGAICVFLNCQGLGVGTDTAGLFNENAYGTARTLGSAGGANHQIKPRAL